jgi:hypothetical protein
MAEGDDRELDDYLRGDSRLSAAYGEVRDAEPPADLDEIVLEKARREVHLGPKVAWSPFIRAWSVPLALAAVLVLSVTVTLVMQEQTGEPLPVPSKPAADGPAVPPPAAPEKAVPAPAPKRAAPPAQVPAPAASFPADSGAVADRFQPAPASPALEAVPSAQRLEGKKAVEAPALRAREEAAADAGLGSDPEAWIRRIEALRREGRDAEADALLAEFRKRFPDYPADRVPR